MFKNGDLLRCIQGGSGVAKGQIYTFHQYNDGDTPGGAITLVYLEGFRHRCFEQRFVLAEEGVVDRILAKYGA